MSKTVIAALLSAALTTGAFAQGGRVEVKDAWARATPSGAVNGAAYLTVQSASADRLTGVSTPVAGKAELHETTMAGGIMKMREVPGIDLPPGQAVTLKPGAVHIMLLGLKQPLKAGGTFPLTLDFAKAGQQQVSVAVEGVGAMGPNASGGGTMSMPMPAKP